MPITVAALLDQCDLKIADTLKWGTRRSNVECGGVYVVSLSADPHTLNGLLARAPISVDLVKSWIDRVHSFTFEGATRPKPEDVAAYIGKFWLPDECNLYIGKGGNVGRRLGLFRSHRLGNKSPHAGGHWLKTLGNLSDLTIFIAECRDGRDPEDVESELLGIFQKQVSQPSRAELPCRDLPLPFANLEWRVDGRTRRKQRKIGHCTAGR